MKIELTSINLNNSIRFYNLLLGTRPSSLAFDQVIYKVNDLQLQLIEGPVSAIDNLNRIPLVTEEQNFRSLFRKMKPFMKGILTEECQVLESSFKINDPDGYEWLVIKKGSPIESSSNGMNICYLEPVNF